MSRAAIMSAILADTRLINLGFDLTNVLPNYDGEQRPNDQFFMVIVYGDEDEVLRGDDVFVRSFQNIEIFVHCYREYMTSYSQVNHILDVLDDILGKMIQVDGTDGYTLTLAEPAARSRDLRDDIYQTICRSGTYRILSRETAPV